MGIIQKQTLHSIIYSYIGAALGFVTVAIVFAHLLSTEQNGLLNILVSISTLTGTVANFGVNGVTLRLFPLFRNQEKKNHGFLFYPLAITFLGFIIFCILFVIFKQKLIELNIEKSKLLTEYIYFLIPLTFFVAFYNVFDTYARVLYYTTAGIFVKEVLQRILVLIFVVFYFCEKIDFSEFVIGYCVSLSLPTLALMVFLFKKKELNPMPKFSFVDSNIRKEMISVGQFSIITGISGMLVSTLDKIILNQKLGLSDVGIFGIAMYFGSVISIPSRSMLRISSTIIAEAWKNNDTETIYKVYHKSCINLFIIGALLFLGIWLNIENILKILPPEYSNGKWVIFFVGIGYLFEMVTGANGIIVATSKYYRYDTYFVVFLVALTFISNSILIDMYGITGSAMAFAITLFSFNLFRFIFVYKKFKMQPLDVNILKVIFISVFTYLLVAFLPHFQNYILDIAVRSFLIVVVFGFLITIFKVSEDLDFQFQNFKNKFLN